MLDAFFGFGFAHAAYRLAPAALWLALIWLAETHLATPRRDRLRHGATNLAIATLNGILLFFSVGLLSIYVCSVSSIESSQPIRIVVSFLLLDLFSYVWHRANHRFPILWCFHTVHHSDAAMDVTTSGRFHVVELGIAAFARLPILFLLGVSTTALLIYETALVMVSMMHHSTMTLGRLDRFFRVVLVTPSVHSVHHSRDPEFYGCNYSSVLSFWDRLFRTFRFTREPVQHGLDGYDDRQSVRALIASPFREDHNRGEPRLAPDSSKTVFGSVNGLLGLGDPKCSSTQVSRFRILKCSLRTLLLVAPITAVGIAAWFAAREQSYAQVDEICAALALGKLDFVNGHLRYGRFARDLDELEFHYITEQGVSRVVHWGNAETRFNEMRNAQIRMFLGKSELTDPEHEEKRLAGIDHEYPRIYDVIFQTNRKNGKVAIMGGGSNAFPYTDDRDEP